MGDYGILSTRSPAEGMYETLAEAIFAVWPIAAAMIEYEQHSAWVAIRRPGERTLEAIVQDTFPDGPDGPRLRGWLVHGAIIGGALFLPFRCIPPGDPEPVASGIV